MEGCRSFMVFELLFTYWSPKYRNSWGNLRWWARKIARYNGERWGIGEVILSGRRGFTSLTTDGCMVGGVCEIPKQNNDFCFLVES